MPQVETSHELSKEDLMDAITCGTNKHKAVFSFDTHPEEENAKLLALSWLSVSQKREYWLIALNQSSDKYLHHRRQFHGNNAEMGSFLFPLQHHIIFCKNKNGETFIPTKARSCVIL